jgi:predicted nucleotidyltransferase
MVNKLTAQSFLRYPLSTILANEGHVRVLRELTQHGGELSVTILSDRTTLTTQGVRNILAALVASGAVAMIGTGRSRLFRIGKHPVMAAVRELFTAEEGTYTDVMDCLRACIRDHQGVLAAWVYGSAVRGEDRPSSDIDIAIVADDAEVEAVAEDVRHTLMESSTRIPCAPALVALGVNDVIRLSSGDPWWVGLAKDAVTLKGVLPEIYARRLRQAQPSTKTKTFEEAPDEMGFVPLDLPKRIIVRDGRPSNPLPRWRRPKEQD